jgi:hypothetical protein
MKLTKSKLQQIIKEELQGLSKGLPERDPANPEGLSPAEWDHQQDARYGSKVNPEEANQELAFTLNDLADRRNLADIIPDLLKKFNIDPEDATAFLNEY